MSAAQRDDTAVVVQDRSRLFRESLAALLGSTGTFNEGVAVATPSELAEECDRRPAAVVLLEAAGVPWDVGGAVASLRDTGHRTVVGTTPARLRRGEGPDLPTVVRTGRLADFLAALAPSPPGTAASADGHDAGHPAPRPGELSGPELQVLALISAGLTTDQIAGRLKASPKTVEKRRQRIFAKLGVQSQSHAVTVAFRTGLLGMAAAPDDPA